MRRQYVLFLTVIGSLLSYTAYKLHEALAVSFWLVLPFMLPLFFIMFGGTLFARSNQLLSEKNGSRLSLQWVLFLSAFGELSLFFR